MKARALKRGLVTGLIAHEQTTRLTGGFDFISKFRQRKIRLSDMPYNIGNLLSDGEIEKA